MTRMSLKMRNKKYAKIGFGLKGFTLTGKASKCKQTMQMLVKCYGDVKLSDILRGEYVVNEKR
jgi:hypothetical protein